jgi:ABC-2 type transport system permease protein
MTASETTARRETAGRSAWQPNVVKLSISRTMIELKQFFRETRSAVFTFAFPVMLLVLFGGIISYTIKGPDGREVNFRQYFISGMIAAGIISTTFNNLATSISMEQQEGLLKRLSATPLPRSAYFAGKITTCTIVTSCRW